MKRIEWMVLIGLIAVVLIGLPGYAFGQSGFRPDDVKIDSAGDGTNVVNTRKVIFQEGTNITLSVDATGDTAIIAATGVGASVWDSLYNLGDTIVVIGERVHDSLDAN